MKLNRTLIIVLVIVLTVLAVITAVPSIMSSGSEYRKYLSEARGYSEDNLCEKAMIAYDKALSEEESLELRLEMAETYWRGIQNGEFDSFYKFSDFLYEMLDKYRKEPSAYDAVVQYFYDYEKYEDCVQIIYQAEDLNIVSDKINALREDVRYKCDLSLTTYNEISITTENTYLIKNDKYTFLNDRLSSDGRKFEYATPMLEGYALVKDEKYTYLVSSDMVRQAYFSNKIKESSGVGEGMIACKEDKTYSYYNLSGEKLFGAYEYAGRFANGIAPVKTEKGWQIIDKNGKQIGNKTFDDIKLNQVGDCSSAGIVIAKTNDKYSFYDCELNKVSDKTFDDTDFAVEKDGMIAVCIKDKWGYADPTGKVVIEPQYDSAKSFSNGLAGAKNGEEWFFVNEKNEKVITGEFFEVNYFNSNGYCFVKNKNYWTYLMRYYNR